MASHSWVLLLFDLAMSGREKGGKELGKGGDAVTHCEHAKRKTVTAMDVVHALKRQGSTLCGFEGQEALDAIPIKHLHI
ncbi:unnamed protein product [Haemonchus placei]|uniref:Histone H4 n=1 Tax=Haemonchus placei TaxID=6290 RepID=A0A0N4WZD6_HAEPC|nr:unnamed protein product [Haemonchus placei]